MVLLGCCAYAQHPNRLNSYVLSGRAQGTTYGIKYYAEQEKLTKYAVDSLLAVIDASMSTYKSNSLISQFNQATTNEIQMDEHMQHVLRASFKYHKLTKGYFDITIFPLLKLWGFGPQGYKKAPTTVEIDSVRQLIGMHKLKLKGNKLRKRQAGLSIDLNGIAQGYSVDQLARLLETKGITSYLVELGGEIRTKGAKPEGKFLVEIQRPNPNQPAHRIKLEDMAITTSGSYEKQLLINGKKVSHHMNPFTGAPLESSIVSATVIAPSAIEADALDNYFMYLTPQQAIETVEKIKNVEIYLIYFDNNAFKELQSSGFYNYIY